MRQHRILAIAAATCLAALSAGCGGGGHGTPAPDIQRAVALRKEFESAGSFDPFANLPEPTGWATLKGSFRVSGSPPPNPQIGLAPELQRSCGINSYTNKQVVTGSGGALSNCAIYLNTRIPIDDTDPAPQWVNQRYAADREMRVPFNQKNCSFLDRLPAIRTTQQLEIFNSDNTGHNTAIGKGFNPLVAANTKPPAQGILYPESPDAELQESRQPVPVSCSIHPWMSANLLVRESPYFDVTAVGDPQRKDGAFELADLPAGVELEFSVWHEAGRIEEVTVNGESVKWPRGRFKLTLEPGQVLSLDVVVSADAFK